MVVVYIQSLFISSIPMNRASSKADTMCGATLYRIRCLLGFSITGALITCQRAICLRNFFPSQQQIRSRLASLEDKKRREKRKGKNQLDIEFWKDSFPNKRERRRTICISESLNHVKMTFRGYRRGRKTVLQAVIFCCCCWRLPISEISMDL